MHPTQILLGTTTKLLPSHNPSKFGRPPNVSRLELTTSSYTFLRLRDHLLANDLLDPVDLHCASPAELNSRVTDLGSGNLHRNRLGVYVHWTLPQVYRTGTSAATDDSTDDIKNQNDRKKAVSAPSVDD